MTGDFNICDSIWDSSFPHHSSINDNLIIIADSFNLDLSIPTDQVPTRYSDTVGESNLVINLMFLQSGSTELNNHSIYSDWQLTSDHAPLTVSIPIAEANINSSKLSITKNSKEEASFIKDISSIIKNLNISNMPDINKLENIVNTLALNTEHVWRKNSKLVNITRHSKSWWNKDCNQSLRNYRISRTLEDWKIFKKTVKSSKQSFFDLKIQEIANKKQGPWELMSWVNKCKLPTIEAIKYNKQLCLTIDALWNALHLTFNTALHRQVDINILDKVINKSPFSWAPFSKEEFKSAIANCNNPSTPELDKLSWKHLKIILKDNNYLGNIISISNACINLGCWPSHFKRSMTVIIPKPNKASYDSPKLFRPIVLLNTLGKLI